MSRLGRSIAERVGGDRAGARARRPAAAGAPRAAAVAAGQGAGVRPDHARRRALADRRSRSPARRATRERSRRCSRAACYATWAPDTLAQRSEQVRELSALLAQVEDLRSSSPPGCREHVRGGRAPATSGGRTRRSGAQAIAEQTRQPIDTDGTRASSPPGRVMRGELEAGERLAEQAFQLGQEAGQPDAAMIYGAHDRPEPPAPGQGRRGRSR